MKTTLFCIAMITLLLVACDRQHPSAAVSTAPAHSADEGEAERAEERPNWVAQMTGQFDTRMMELDANGDGLLTKEEMLSQSQSRFDRMDSNGDGAIDAGEREAVIEDMADVWSQFNRDRVGGSGARGGNDRRRE